jgi:hypothetical protein
MPVGSFKSVARGLGHQGFGEVCSWVDLGVHTVPIPRSRDARRGVMGNCKTRKSKRCKEKNSHPFQIKTRELRISFQEVANWLQKQAKEQPRLAPPLVF